MPTLNADKTQLKHEFKRVSKIIYRNAYVNDRFVRQILDGLLFKGVTLAQIEAMERRLGIYPK